MKNSPLILSVFVGLIIVLAIASGSFFVSMKKMSIASQEEMANRMNLQKELDDVKSENAMLKEENSKLQNSMNQLITQIDKFKKDIVDLEIIKRNVEEALKQEVAKREATLQTIQEKVVQEKAAVGQEGMNIQTQKSEVAQAVEKKSGE